MNSFRAFLEASLLASLEQKKKEDYRDHAISSFFKQTKGKIRAFTQWNSILIVCEAFRTETVKYISFYFSYTQREKRATTNEYNMQREKVMDASLTGEQRHVRVILRARRWLDVRQHWDHQLI